MYVNPFSKRPNSDTLSPIDALSPPALTIPAKSPLTSAIITGTPISEKDSAKTFRLTVFPVPVAPAISPCLFAILGSIYNSLSADLAIYNPLSVYIIAPSKIKSGK